MNRGPLRPADILSHHEMCSVEGKMLQQGMNYRASQTHSVVLMSQRKNAPYPDRLSDDGKTLFYVGHDAYGVANKSEINQPLSSNTGALTQNGLFFRAVRDLQTGSKPELVRVYEKLHPGIWCFNGMFRLLGATFQHDGKREVCVFELQLIEDEDIIEEERSAVSTSPGRMIPTNVKLAVIKRDHGKCVVCGSSSDLHFDHILPFSKGGSSLTAENIQLLCRKHNLEKSDRII